MIIIEQTGPLALVQDLGRPGLAHLGVSASGAADRAAFRLANRLVGNAEDAAGIEVTLGGLVISSDRAVWCAVTGPPVGVDVDGRALGSHHSVHLRAGQRLAIEAPRHGLRNYLALRGGLDVAPVLGSASTDVLAGLGPKPLQPGDRLALHPASTPLPAADFAPPPDPVQVLTLTPGPRRDWFTAEAWEVLLGNRWEVSAESNRVGIRLTGPGLERRIHQELPSEGILSGAIQVPASGQPLIFGPDHALTGGYPVIAVLTATSCDAAAQLRGGDVVSLRLRSLDPGRRPGP